MRKVVFHHGGLIPFMDSIFHVSSASTPHEKKSSIPITLFLICSLLRVEPRSQPTNSYSNNLLPSSPVPHRIPTPSNPLFSAIYMVVFGCPIPGWNRALFIRVFSPSKPASRKSQHPSAHSLLRSISSTIHSVSR